MKKYRCIVDWWYSDHNDLPDGTDVVTVEAGSEEDAENRAEEAVAMMRPDADLVAFGGFDSDS